MDMIFRKLIPLVDFLAEVLGSNVEIVLHDFSDVENSVIAIRNGHISGRGIGAPATDLALRVIKDAALSSQDYLVNYQGKSQMGKILRSSSFMIRNDIQQIVGMLCINIDESGQPGDFGPPMTGTPDMTIERFGKTVDDVTDESIMSVLSKIQLPPERLSQDEKIEIIKELNGNGVFLMKGSVHNIAAKLKISEASVYRYLNKIRKAD